MSPCTTVARAEVIRRLGGFYEKNCRYAEDARLWLAGVAQLSGVVLFKAKCSGTPEMRSHLSATGRVFGRLNPFSLHPEEIRAECPEAVAPAC